MKLFQYAIIHNSGPKKSELLMSKSGSLVTSILAEDLDKAKMLAARDIPDDFVSKLDEIELAIRPF